MKSKRQVTIKRTIDFVNKTILFVPHDSDGKLIVGEGLSCHVDCKKFSKTMFDNSAVMGANHSIGDEGAKSQGATLRSKFDSMNERASYMMSGADAWTTGRGPSENTLLFRAMSEAYANWTPEEVQIQIAEWKERAKKAEIGWPTYQAKLLQSQKLAEIVARLRAEEASGAQIDTDELFAELDDAE